MHQTSSEEARRSIRPDDGWFAKLGERFTDVAQRRVPEDDVADVVQDALRVVHEKREAYAASHGDEHGPPPLAWCHQVLRHTIGNYYQRRNARRRDVPLDTAAARLAAPSGTPIEALERTEALRAIGEALAALDAGDAQCGRLLRRVLDGAGARQLAAENDLEERVLYRRLYRCRQKLRRFLAERGVIA